MHHWKDWQDASSTIITDKMSVLQFTGRMPVPHLLLTRCQFYNLLAGCQFHIYYWQDASSTSTRA
ncbi:MAG: hypothetical protein F6J86_34925 [Symploca sp. SIO1B1]|nr:hypothetical protein [Symploca sp. SIO1B1]